MHVNHIIFVIEAEKTPVHVVKNALKLIKSDREVSIVLNKSNQHFNKGYGYYS